MSKVCVSLSMYILHTGHTYTTCICTCIHIYTYIESSRTNYGWCPCGHTDVQRKSKAIEGSRTGGQSTLRSSKHMHNRMGKRHPERTCPRANHSTATENPVRGPDGPSLPAHATCQTRWSQLGHGRSHRDVCAHAA